MSHKVDKAEYKPGDGWRSLKTTSLFRAANFELYAKTNPVTMVLGGIALFGCVGYLTYINLTSDRSNNYVAINEDGSFAKRPKQSRWD